MNWADLTTKPSVGPVRIRFDPGCDDDPMRPLGVVVELDVVLLDSDDPGSSFFFESEGWPITDKIALDKVDTLEGALEKIDSHPDLPVVKEFLRHLTIKDAVYEEVDPGELESGVLCCTLCDFTRPLGLTINPGDGRLCMASVYASVHFYEEHYKGSFTKGAAKE